MRKVIALALCCFASSAFAQVGGGVVGSLGANGAVSRFGGLGTGITSGATMRGEDLRQTGQLSAETRGNAAGGIDTNVKPGGVSTGVNAGGGASASTPIVNGTASGSADASAQATTPDVKDTVRDTKSTARQKIDRVEESRDKLENRGDKKVDKALQ